MEFKLYETFPLTEYEFLKLMEKTSKLFTPPLSEVIDIEEYSEKVYTYASFVVCYDEKKINGFIAFYRNITEKQLYITLICVDKVCQQQGVGSKMFEVLFSLKKDGFCSVGLEVVKTNLNAYHFYKHHGFIELEDRGKKFLMHKEL